MRVGLDVGGTNTDAVLLDGSTVVAWAKVATSDDVAGGIQAVMQDLLGQSRVEPDRIDSVMLGTTQFANAIVQGRGLNAVGVLRLSLPVGTGIPPLEDWPADLVTAISPRVHQVHGGFEVHGAPIAPLDRNEILEAALSFARAGIRDVAISGVFSPMDPAQEVEAASCVREVLPDARISLGHEIGSLGLLERENACILNASLGDVAAAVVDGFVAALRATGLRCAVFLTQNDGTLMTAAMARRYPVRTVGSGPTNSMRGAAAITGMADAVVVDVGGTTSDIGVLVRGFPRPAALTVSLGGVRTNFPMPDVLSLGLGGGSLVRTDGDALRLGPDSVGNRLTRDALVFGGAVPTVSDAAVAAGRLSLGNHPLPPAHDGRWGGAVLAQAAHMVEEGIDRMKTSVGDVPVVLVGGGSALLPDRLRGADRVVRPDHAQVANAIGAALAQVGAEIDRVVDLEPAHRGARLDALRRDVIARAQTAGAQPRSVEVVDVEETPLTYMPGHRVRVRMRAVGDLETLARRPAPG